MSESKLREHISNLAPSSENAVLKKHWGGDPKIACPDLIAEIFRLENEVDTLKAELEKWIKAAASWEKLSKQESKK